MELRYAGGMSTANQGSSRSWRIGKSLRSFLPPEWAEQARRLGAMRRLVTSPIRKRCCACCSCIWPRAVLCGETAARASAFGFGADQCGRCFQEAARCRTLGTLGWRSRCGAQRILPLTVAGRRGYGRLMPTSSPSRVARGRTGKVHWAVNLADLQCDFFSS